MKLKIYVYSIAGKGPKRSKEHSLFWRGWGGFILSALLILGSKKSFLMGAVHAL